MAGIVTLLYYQLYFDDAAAGAAAQAANGGDINLPLSPETALATYPAGVILQSSAPFFANCPGTVDLGGYTPTVGLPGIVHSPRILTTAPFEQVVTDTVYGNNLDIQQVNTVTYQWNGTIVYTHKAIHPTPGSATGKFELQVVSWVGDGSSNRLIPTTFPLDSGVVAIWGTGAKDGTGVLEVNFFRHNQSTPGIGAMLGTSICGLNSAPIVGQGIVSFEAGGFRVTAGVSVANFANSNTVVYSAVVMRDTTSDNHCLRCGSYIGTSGGQIVVNVTKDATAVTHSGGTAYAPWSGRLVIDTAHANKPYVFTYTGPTSGSLSPAYVDTPTNPTTLSFATTEQVITPPGKASPLTHVWIWGLGVTYKSVEIPDPYSVDLYSGASGSVPLTTMVIALGSANFHVTDPVSANHSVNTFNKQYDYLALSVDAQILAQNMFYSFGGTGAGSPPTTVTNLPFSPELIFARQGSLSAFTVGGLFRIASLHTGTNSALCANIAGNNTGTNGITALAGTTVGYGSNAAQAAAPYYSWMFKGGAITVNPTYTENDAPTTPPTPPTTPGPPPAACVAPLFTGLNSTPCAAPAPLFP